MEQILVGPHCVLPPSHDNNNNNNTIIMIIITPVSLLLLHQITTGTVATKCTNDLYCAKILQRKKKMPVIII